MATTRSPRNAARRSGKQLLPDWSQLLIDAVQKPGVISGAYQFFWNYSTSNQLIAYFTCLIRRIEPGPIHTFKGWLRLGRHVKRGEKAIELCMPVTWKKKVDQSHNQSAVDLSTDSGAAIIRRRFVYRPNWFVLSQTDGSAYQPLAIPQWEEKVALHELAISRVPFQSMNGNVMGYAQGREVAVSPLAYLPYRTLFHEIAHVLLGHTAELIGMTDHEERTPKDVREVEAEAVAYICCQSLGMPGEEFSRGYLQHWLGEKQIEPRSAQRIFHAADQILKAGRPKVSVENESTDSHDNTNLG